MPMKVIGAVELGDNLTRLVTEKYPAEIGVFMKETGDRVLARTKERTPVITGNLRRGWKVSEVTIEPGRVAVEVFNAVEYAPHVEYGHVTGKGTGYRTGRYMLHMAVFEEMGAVLQKRLAVFLKRLFKKSGVAG